MIMGFLKRHCSVSCFQTLHSYADSSKVSLLEYLITKLFKSEHIFNRDFYFIILYCITYKVPISTRKVNVKYVIFTKVLNIY